MINWLGSLGDNAIFLGVGFAVLLYLALLAMGRWFKRELKVSFGGIFQLFALLAAIFLGVWLPFSTRSISDWPAWLTSLSKWLIGLLIFSGVTIVARVISKYFMGDYLWHHHKLRVPKLIQDLAFALILLIGFLIGGKILFPHLPIDNLLAAGGVLGIILGLALQSVLSDAFAGIALNIERPFQVGDWVQVGGIHGEIIEINWRATRLRTTDNNYLIIPNANIAKDHIVNFYAPDRRHALRVTVGIEYSAEPNRVKKILSDAARTVDSVSNDQEPTVRITQFGDFAITYEVKYWIDDHAHYQEINDAVRTAIWYALKKADIKIPFPIREIHPLSSTSK